jgi:broad specificity phosphatase PhoE
MRRIVLSLIVLLLAVPAWAQQVVFVVRHAERADAVSGASPTMASDPDLSDAGRTRAQSLAAALKDAGIVAIFVTPYKRTQQTAEPLAKALGLQPVTIDPKDASGMIEKVKGVKGNVLVVGHSNTVPDLLRRLGAADAPSLGDADYDNLFVVVRGETPTLVRLHFR